MKKIQLYLEAPAEMLAARGPVRKRVLYRDTRRVPAAEVNIDHVFTRGQECSPSVIAAQQWHGETRLGVRHHGVKGEFASLG